MNVDKMLTFNSTKQAKACGNFLEFKNFYFRITFRVQI